MSLKLSNNVSGILAEAISGGATSLTLKSGHGLRFPLLSSGSWFPITVVRASDPSQLEIMRCTARSGDTLTVVRAQEGTSALSFYPGDVVELRLTAGTLEENFPQVEGRNAKNLRFIIGSVGGKPELKFKSGGKEETVLRRSDLTTGRTDSTLGRVLKVGDFGVGATISISLGDNLDIFTTPGEYYQSTSSFATPDLNYPVKLAGFLKVATAESSGIVQEYTTYGSTRRKFLRGYYSGTWSGWVEFYHTGNTTVDANGHLLVASPIIRLYDDRIEVEGNFHQPPQFERLDVGVYRITGTLGLRLDDGWYLETPTDRNGNKYFNVEWEQDVEPENEAGIVDEPVDVELIIRTYERVWNPQSGRHENGDPVDINERQKRHIALRFNELRREDPEPPTHDPS